MLWQAHQSGVALAALPTRPASRVDGYAVQAAVAAHEPAPAVGWKIAATNVAGQQHIGVDGPLAGRLYASRTHAPGRPVSMFGNRMAVAEPEFCFRMARTVAGPAPAGRWTVTEVEAAVGSLHLAIELPNSRFADFVRAGAAQLIADNACAHETVIGPAVTADWHAMDLSAHGVSIASRTTRNDGVGRNVLGGPLIALTWLANELSGLGMALEAGQYVITGTAAVPLPVAAGDRVLADFGVLGQVGVTLTA
jgi:2-keto-4-pentenoate hydratase